MTLTRGLLNARFCYVLFCSSTALAVAQPSLRITSPVDGTVVTTGQTFKVTVEASGGPFQAVFIVCNDPIGTTISLAAPPYEFSIPIPDKGKIEARKYLITADGYTSPGHGVNSESVAVLVEPSEPPVSLRADPPALYLAVGEKVGYLSVIGTFTDGTYMYISQSTRNKYTSTATSVVTVDAHGIVTAVGLGSAKLVVMHGEAKVEVPIEVSKEGLRIRE